MTFDALITTVKAGLVGAAAGGTKGLQRALGVADDGIIGPRTLAALDAANIDTLLQKISPAKPPAPAPRPPTTASPAWLKLARDEVGFHEVGDNRGIGRYIELGKCGSEGDPWCAIFANAMLESSGTRGTQSAASQSFRRSSLFVQLRGPALGALAVYWRNSPDSGLGHVGFYMGERDALICTLGGNESDMVRYQWEPRAKLVGYWWPKGVKLPAIKEIILPANGCGGDGGDGSAAVT